MKLDGYGQQVSASFNIEKTQARAHVPSFQVRSVLTIVWNVLQDFVIHHVDPTFLENIGTSLISSERLERFSYDLEMKTRKQNRNNRRTNIERFGWFIERI